MEDSRYILGEPIEVNTVGVIYPLTILEFTKNSHLFYCLSLNVNQLMQQIDDSEIERKEFIEENMMDFDLIMNNTNSFETFVEILELVMKININDLKILKDDDGYIYIESDECHIDRYNYPNFREVVCIMNGLPIPNDNPNKELQYWLDKARKNRNRKNKLTLEDIITIVIESTGIPHTGIKEMTMYQLNKQLERANLTREHQIAVYGALVGGKGEVPPFIRHSEEVNENLTVSLNEFKNRLGMGIK